MMRRFTDLIKMEVSFARWLKREGMRYPLLPAGGHFDRFMRKTFAQ